MDEAIPFDQMTAEEIAELLSELGTEVGDDEAALLRDLIVQLGGLHEALEVLDELADEREAA